MKCSCAKLKAECGPDCGCDPKTCNNRQMVNNEGMKLGVDVIEKVTWGMDICTAVNFISVCPKDMKFEDKSKFVAKKLTYAI